MILFFYPNPHEIKIEDDGERSTDVEFRNAIIDKYESYYLNQYQWKDKIVRLKGTVEERMDMVKSIIDFYIK